MGGKCSLLDIFRRFLGFWLSNHPYIKFSGWEFFNFCTINIDLTYLFFPLPHRNTAWVPNLDTKSSMSMCCNFMICIPIFLSSPSCFIPSTPMPQQTMLKMPIKTSFKCSRYVHHIETVFELTKYCTLCYEK